MTIWDEKGQKHYDAILIKRANQEYSERESIHQETGSD